MLLILSGCTEKKNEDYSSQPIEVDKLMTDDSSTDDKSTDEGKAKEESSSETEGEDSASSDVIDRGNISLNINESVNQEKASIDLSISGVDNTGKQVWERSWKDVLLTELDPYSETASFNNTAYIEISGMLYGLNMMDGTDVFEPVMVGSIPTPIINDLGEVFCAGYYGPFLTKVDTNGKILWQISDSETMYWPYDVRLKDGFAYVEYSGTDSQINMVQIDEKSGDLLNKYHSDGTNIIWDSITSSSELNGYSVLNLVDNDPSTGWVEGKDDYGIGEWIQFESISEEKISTIEILNGYHKSESLYNSNSRPKSVLISFSDGTEIEKELKDDMKRILIELDTPKLSSSIRIKVLSVYEGTKYKDTVISDISIH